MPDGTPANPSGENPEKDNGPLNEWLFDEYIRTKDNLLDLMKRHETVVDNYARVCRQNDKFRQIGQETIATLDAWYYRLAKATKEDNELLDELVTKWQEAEV